MVENRPEAQCPEQRVSVIALRSIPAVAQWAVKTKAGMERSAMTALSILGLFPNHWLGQFRLPPIVDDGVTHQHLFSAGNADTANGSIA